jgi:NAD(P)-dependent dehydrogenase (short-subunit alcohol dehydrogenase family)
MELDGISAIISGGASGLGEATARAVVARGGRVAIVDYNLDKATALAGELGKGAHAFQADVSDGEAVGTAFAGAVEALGEIRLAVGCAGIGWAQRTISREGPAPVDPFESVIRVNLIGMYNFLRHAAWAMNQNEPNEEGERGCVVMTASVAAFEGQIGQTAYAASKGGVVSLTLPAARDLASRGIRVNTIAPGLFDTPLFGLMPDEQREALGAGIPFPKRLGKPSEFAHLVCAIAENPMMNGATVRLDGALRMAPS